MSFVNQFMIPIKLRSEKLTSTADQSVFTLSSITIPNSDPLRVMVNINGKKQPTDAYTINSSTQVTMSENLELNDIVEIIVPSR
jgi:hypothetical protein